MLSKLLGALATKLYAFRLAVLAGWVAVLVLSAWGAQKLESVLIGGSGAIQGSPSERVDDLISRDFANPFSKALLVTFRSDADTVDRPRFARLVQEAAHRLAGSPDVRKVMSYYQTRNPRLRSDDGHATVLLVGVAARDIKDEEQRLPRIRSVLETLKTAPEAVASGMKIATTGRSALMVDLNSFNARDSGRAESRALPLTLGILVIAFGSLVAAGIPLLMGIVSTTATLGLSFLLGQHLELSNLTENIATMLGLAVGIDYSLLMVNRFREALAHGAAVPEAVSETVRTAGRSVLVSGVAVVIGFSGLLLTPLFETRSVGIGGLLVILISILVALTLVPALLAVVGTHLDRPLALSRVFKPHASARWWREWANRLMDHPGKGLAAALVLTALLAWPATRWVSGFPSEKWFPREMEARQGLDVLASMHQGWSIFPVYLVVRGPGPITAGPRLEQLLSLSRILHAEPKVDSVYGPVDLRGDLPPMAYRVLYHDLARALRRFPQIGELFLSHDRRSALFQVIFKDATTLEEAKHLVGAWQQTKLGEGLAIEVGGQATFYNDYDAAMNQSFPRVVGFVLVATFLILFFAYRSWLLPLKAIAMNLLSVAAGYGALVAVFLLGWGRQLVGLSETIDAIPQSVPLIIFCVVFGLGMDYEVFLLSRIKEAYDEHHDNRRATVEGLARSGGLITSAALIMAVVFGAFSGAEMVIVKMLGFGLTVAVLVDATLIRCLAVPAFMSLAGRWNWLPGDRKIGRPR